MGESWNLGDHVLARRGAEGTENESSNWHGQRKCVERCRSSSTSYNNPVVIFGGRSVWRPCNMTTPNALRGIDNLSKYFTALLQRTMHTTVDYYCMPSRRRCPVRRLAFYWSVSALLHAADEPTPSQLAADMDDNLFANILNHVSHEFLPEFLPDW